MKKTKILTVLGILLAMGITACGVNNGDKKSQETPDTQDSTSQMDSDHKHSFKEWTQTKAPTCTEKGEEESVCECGEKKTRDVKALGHDWGEWTATKAATCTEDGAEERTCKRCGEKDTQAVKAGHSWNADQDVAVGTDPADQVGFKLANCKNNDAIKIEIKATDAKFYSGSIKSGTPSGYFKLSSNGNKAYWKFSVPGEKIYKGILYQRGAMDQFSGNTDKAYAHTSTSGDHAPKYPLGNFDAVVNGDSIDKSQWIDTPYSELLADGEDSSAMGSDYSPICLAPIGECVIQSGLNEITYQRIGSYNLIISELVFIGAEFEHTHAAAADWSSDDNQHWHACTAVGCPTGKLDVANHTFGEWETTKAATCKEAGERQHTCSVCGKVIKEEVAKLAHTLGEAYDVVAATCEAAGSQKKKCSVCEEVITEVLPKLDHKFGDAVDAYAAGEGYIASTAHNCSTCEKSALRWNAKDFDATLSSTELEVNDDNIRFKSGSAENKGGTEGAGSHIVYKINVPAAVEKAGLAFYIQNTGGSGSGAANISPVFGMIAGDGTVGAIKGADGKFTTATHRYGLKVNDVEYFLGDDNYGNQNKVKAWFEWPVEFPLKAGVNTIDVFPYAGYRANLYQFEVTGLPKAISSHTHALGEWQSDDSNHWKICSAAGCPAGANAHLEEAAHDWVAGAVAIDGAKGTQTFTCSVCGKTKTVNGAVFGSFKWADAIQADSATLDGTKFKASSTYSFRIFNVPAAGTYTLTLPMKGSSGNETKTLNGSGQGFSIAANGNAGTFYGNGKTYAEFFGDDQNAWVNVLFGEVALVEGTNVITITTTSGGYRTSINVETNLVLAAKA